MTDVVLLDVSERIATITLNRPDRLNAVTAEILHAVADAVDSSSANTVMMPSVPAASPVKVSVLSALLTEAASPLMV